MIPNWRDNFKVELYEIIPLIKVPINPSEWKGWYGTMAKKRVRVRPPKNELANVPTLGQEAPARVNRGHQIIRIQISCYELTTEISITKEPARA